MIKGTFLALAIVMVSVCGAVSQVYYPGQKPGRAKSMATSQRAVLWNRIVEASWTTGQDQPMTGSFKDKATGTLIDLGGEPLFAVKMVDGRTITSRQFTLKAPVQAREKSVDKRSSKIADGIAGKVLYATFISASLRLEVDWEASLGDGANYIRQTFTFRPADSLAAEKINLVNLPPGTKAVSASRVDGSPLISGNSFFAIEHPMSQAETLEQKPVISLPRQSAITAAAPVSLSTVWGVAPAGQLRRAFLFYTERERAAPYTQKLHYNSWYDLSWIDRKLDEQSCLDRIQVFADSLIIKRKVRMDAFLFDDGWDNNQTLWQFNSGFPQGFAKLTALAGKYNSDLGVWISPWGGYLEDQKQRLSYGAKQNPPFETNKNGFSLSGPIYYRRFRDVAASFVKDYQVKLFKFDGVGAGNGADGASVSYQRDIEALLKLVGELRGMQPDLYFSLTVGTWPSVYWLNYGNVIWRAGKDTEGTGPGNNRQKWITYRDAEVYKNVVQRAPLFPLNALMLHGICIAQNGPPAKYELLDKDISDEIWSFFGTGTSLQELYINPHKLNTTNWNTLADAINWSRKNESVLADAHWVGGDPRAGKVYGYAAWSKGKGTLTLRNPTASPQKFLVNVDDVFQLPAGQSKPYRFYDAKSGMKEPRAAGKIIELSLEPFEVLVFSASPGN